jgi:hypothetical protein
MCPNLSTLVKKLFNIGLNCRKGAQANNVSNGILFRGIASCFSGTQSWTEKYSSWHMYNKVIKGVNIQNKEVKI